MCEHCGESHHPDNVCNYQFNREKVSAKNHKKRQMEQVKNLMKQNDELREKIERDRGQMLRALDDRDQARRELESFAQENYKLKAEIECLLAKLHNYAERAKDIASGLGRLTYPPKVGC